MKNATPILITFLILSISCNQSGSSVSNGLRVLTVDEMIERVNKNEFPDPKKTICKDQDGNIIPFSDFQKLVTQEKYAADTYVDKDGEVKEFVIRKATEEDKVAAEKLKNATQRRIYPEVKTVDIDCSKLNDILQKVYEADQDTRKEESSYDPTSDHKNLETVISIINKCGMPTLREVGQTQMSAIWLVIQHAPGKYRKQYIGMLEKSAKNGDLQKTDIAMMKDRILMDDGKPQIYGTQISMNQKTGEWELYNLENPAYVNQRRKEIGFTPIEEYLTHFNLTFDIPQKKIK